MTTYADAAAKTLSDPVTLTHAPTLKNRFALAPLTNLQSHADGKLSTEEFHWLTMRAKGGFALTMTCAAHVQAIGQGFPGQLGVFSDDHLPGLTHLAEEIQRNDSQAWVQLHHAGMRSPADLINTQPVCPSDNEKTGARGLAATEVQVLIDDFIAAAVRADRAGFDGVQVHGAHGYILCQFLSPEINHRQDSYGGSLDNRNRIIDEILDGIRQRCRAGFGLALRLSPERFGIPLKESTELAERYLQDPRLDFLDMSLWDVFKPPEEGGENKGSLLEQFAALPRNGVRLSVAGKIRTPAEAQRAVAMGADLVTLGRAAILQHDFPQRCLANPLFTVQELPVSRAYLEREGLSAKFIDYLAGWEGFVKPD